MTGFSYGPLSWLDIKVSQKITNSLTEVHYFIAMISLLNSLRFCKQCQHDQYKIIKLIGSIKI